ncbi:MAG: sensor domain-containing diguanylate cyclase [Inhella sp.]|jgi:diguanylate cyclase (GGDEF)-like protein/PAS domain S-box-containing protein|uniref:sensor domain-containing diguanylate cyclase n=1 Tax=Inhella sp. TaxID=1921806 RepID=UPI0022C36176|nr:sensor domain-containing diguanylate cyclase [Inhella sp.]MCZ8235792.1 sensor domain-containing diguanylate cyclase [Inhella sp.]
MSAHDPRFAALMQRSPLAVAFVAGERFIEVSEAFSHLFGHVDDHDLQGSATRSVLVSDASQKSLTERLMGSFQAGKASDEEVEMVRRDGSRFWGRLQASPLDWAQPSGEALWVVQDVTAARAARLAPTWAAKHDPVTELSNRREFERRLAEHVGSRRNEPVSVLWVDLDGFGDIVSSMGHETADHFLYGMGQLLQSKVRASDTVARIESDRFAVLLPDCDQHYAEIVAEKIRAAVSTFRLRWGLHRARTKASLGVVLLHPTLETPDAVLAAAALACGEAKAAGGDCVRIFVLQQPVETKA